MDSAPTLMDLRKSALFNKMTEEQIRLLSKVFKIKTVTEGATLFVENMQGESLYLIESGTIKITKMLAEGDEQVMAILGPDDVFGEMAIFAGDSRAVSARVAETANLFSLSRSDYDKLSQVDPKLSLLLTQNIIAIFSERLRGAQNEYREMLLASIGRKS